VAPAAVVRQEEPIGAGAAVGARPEVRLRESGSSSVTNLPPPDLGMQPPAPPPPPQPRRVEAPPMGPVADQGRDNWLSDLLNR
ncbi:hypothetical protein, partial [Aeromonas veronii]|uniref:hypothetical protein n=1 Tax=Aeromonas veronii TaxID=654 RepID=UPI00406CC083